MHEGSRTSKQIGSDEQWVSVSRNGSGGRGESPLKDVREFGVMGCHPRRMAVGRLGVIRSTSFGSSGWGRFKSVGGGNREVEEYHSSSSRDALSSVILPSLHTFRHPMLIPSYRPNRL